MEPNTATLNFLSLDPIDKIVSQGEITINNDGSTTFPDEAKIVTATATNPYGKAVLARARWSVDGGTSWQSIDSRLMFQYDDSGTTLYGLRAAISVGCSDGSVYFRTANGYHGDVSLGVYTSNSQTFTIQYALFEDVPE